METINLYRMRRLGRKLNKMLWKIKVEESRAERMTAYVSGMPARQGILSRVEEGAIRLTELKEAYGEAFESLEKMRREMDGLIDSLANPDDRAVMRLRYLKGRSPEEIAETIFMSDRMVYYILARAEKELARRFPGKVTEGK